MHGHVVRRGSAGAYLPRNSLASIALALTCAAHVDAQSFDCRRARYSDERAICRDPALRQLDEQLAGAYRQLILKLANPDREQLDQEEDRFVAARHRCSERSACIEQSYRERIRYLEQALARENARTTRP